MGDSVKRDAKSIFGERGPHKKQLRERTKFHGREEIRGHGKISVFLRIKSICHNFHSLCLHSSYLDTNSK